MKPVMILGALLLTCVAVAQTFGAGNDRIAGLLPPGDAAPVSQQEARLFGPALCNDAEDLFGEGWGACKYLLDASYPTLLFKRGPAFILFNVLYGSFTGLGAQEALVTLLYEGSDCCTERTVLFERTGRIWRPTRLLEKTSAPAYLVFTTESGRALLVRRRDDSGLSELPFLDVVTSPYSFGFELSVTDAGLSKARGLLIDFSNPIPNCLFPYASGARYAEIANWSRQDVSGDGLPDLVLDLEVTVLSDVRCEDEAFTEDPRKSPPTLERLVFLFDGQRFRPTPTTGRFKEYSQRPQGEAF